MDKQVLLKFGWKSSCSRDHKYFELTYVGNMESPGIFEECSGILVSWCFFEEVSRKSDGQFSICTEGLLKADVK